MSLDPATEHDLQARAGIIADRLSLEELRFLAKLPECEDRELVLRAIKISEHRSLESSLALTDAYERLGKPSFDIGF